MKWENVEFFINIILTVISAVGAYKSIRYFRKSKYITIYAQSKKALNELGEMLELLPELMSLASSFEKKGFNKENAISQKGNELEKHLNEIMREIPSEYSAEFRELQRVDCFDLEQYVYSLIGKSALIEENGEKLLDRSEFDLCQERLRVMQEFLKKKIVEEEEKLK